MTRRLPLPNDAVLASSLCRDLRLFIQFAGLVLIYATSPLWFGAGETFPEVPLVSWCVGWPGWLDRIASWLMVVSLASLLLFREGGRATRIAVRIFLGAFLLAVLLNQHRLQPWAYEFCILLLVMELLPPEKAVPCLRLIVASIYLHSGLSKLDVTFLSTHGETFVSVITNAIGWNLSEAPEALRRMIVATLPVGEILIAVGLCFAKTRRLAKWFSVVMHLLLIWILGPWGLDHQPGVLIWNVYFIAQNLVLFQPVLNFADWNDRPADTEPHAHHLAHFLAKSHVEDNRTPLWGYGLTGLVVLLPFLEPFGLYDHWPSWAVYASRPERTRVYISEDRVSDLAGELQGFVSEDEKSPEAAERFLAGKPAWRRLRIDRWCLEMVHAPLYPQDRFQVGVALALAETYDLGDDIRVEIDSSADRFTGERTTRIINGTEPLRQAGEGCRLNARPR